MTKEIKDYLTDVQLLRKKAEEQLKLKHSQAGVYETEHDMKRLLHELQVHEIELEMQNEELREAYEATELTLKKYTMLYDLAPMGYFTLEADGSIFELNFTGAEMLGDRRFSLEKNNLRLYIAEESKLVFDKFLHKVFTGDYKESCKVRLGYDNNPLGYVYMEAVVIGEDRKCLLSVVDISNFQR